MANSLEKWMDKGLNIQDSFDRLFNEFVSLKKANGMREFNFSPSCEISEDASKYVLKFDLPGIPKEQVKVEADQNQLTVSAERKEEKQSADKRKRLSEIYYGSYTRTFALPSPIQEKAIDAKFENGVLTVTVPKAETAKTKQIPIQ